MLTWTCHVCKKLRPDAMIAVNTRDISMINGVKTGTITQNIRYCKDNPLCEEEAKHFRFFKDQLKGVK